MIKLKNIYTSTNSHGRISYLYDRETKIILPIETRTTDGDFARLFLPLLTALKAKVTCIEIYLYQEGTFYSYISVRNVYLELYKINATISQSLKLAKMLNTPIFIKNEILNTQGIRVTRQLLENALRKANY